MYAVAVTRDFVARHFLIGGDWGDENSLHSHHYRVEVTLEGQELDQHGYLVDIVEIESVLESLVERYRDQTLNELPEFESLNPSVERFAAILSHSFSDRVTAPSISLVRVRLWENDIAWASFEVSRR